jgi:hypothetical protein
MRRRRAVRAGELGLASLSAATLVRKDPRMTLVRSVVLALAVLLPAAWTSALASQAPPSGEVKKAKKGKKTKKGNGEKKGDKKAE